jgi:large repetitive protein
VLNGSTVSFRDAGRVAIDVINTYDASVGTSAYVSQEATLPGTLPAVGTNTDGALFLASEQSYAASAGYGYDADGNLLGYHSVTTSNVARRLAQLSSRTPTCCKTAP